MKNKKLFFGLFFLIMGLLAGITLSVKLDIFPKAQSAQSQVAAVPEVASPTVSFEGYRMEDAVINVANATGRAVVSISTEHIAKVKGGRRYYFSYPFGESPFGEEEPFRRFFDDFFGEMPEREYKQTGLGSGVIIDKEGYILTNEHVIDQADKITVTLPDGREFKGEIKGVDRRSDLAIIKINAANLPLATLGDSDNLKIGQWVVAIGNPFGFALENAEPTVTCGVISALHRSLGRVLSRDRDYSDLVQTDAAINPGNSGGPLVNLKGEIVGINVAIFSTSGGYQGVGFAIPVNNAKRIISRLIEGKKILYGWLGITIQDLSDDLAKYFGLADKKGVLVAKVLENSPAQKAGMKESDVIKKFDHQEINNVKELLSAVAKAEVGRKIKLGLVRQKQELTLEVEVGERPQDLEGAFTGAEESKAPGWRGIKAQDLSPEISRRFRIEEKNGVAVADVEPGSPAEAAGIISGDVILEINKLGIKNMQDYQGLTKDLKGGALVKTARGYFLVKEKIEQ